MPISCDYGPPGFLSLESAAGDWLSVEDPDFGCAVVDADGTPLFVDFVSSRCDASYDLAANWLGFDGMSFGCDSHQFPIVEGALTYDPSYSLDTLAGFGRAILAREISERDGVVTLRYSAGTEPRRKNLERKPIAAEVRWQPPATVGDPLVVEVDQFDRQGELVQSLSLVLERSYP